MPDLGICLTMIEIDGSYKEGGGQIIRTALALSVYTGKAFRATKIRHNRTKPGLKNQHLACIKALEELAFCDVRNAELGCESFEFSPGRITPKTLSVDIGTAGSITLLMQSLLLPCSFAQDKIRLKIKGGTDTKWSMSMDFFINLVLPFYNTKINDMKRGYYPKGQGILDITIKPLIKQPINITQPHIDKIFGISSASSSLRHAEVAERQARAAKRKLSEYKVRITEEYQQTASPGSVITLWTGSIGSNALGAIGIRSESIGNRCAKGMLELIKSNTADSHLADNLIPLLAVSGGSIMTKISDHILSNIYVCEKFLDMKFKIKEKLIEVS